MLEVVYWLYQEPPDFLFLRIYYGYIDYFLIRIKDLYGFISSQLSDI